MIPQKEHHHNDRSNRRSGTTHHPVVVVDLKDGGKEKGSPPASVFLHNSKGKLPSERNNASSDILAIVAQIPYKSRYRRGERRRYRFAVPAPEFICSVDSDLNFFPDSGNSDLDASFPDKNTRSKTESGRPRLVSSSSLRDVNLPSKRSCLKTWTRTSKPQGRASLSCRSFEVRILGREEPVVRRPSIAFDKIVRVKAVPSVATLATKPEQIWFQQPEYKAIRQNSLDLVRQAEGKREGRDFQAGKRSKSTRNLVQELYTKRQMEDEEEEEDCMRGLELFSKKSNASSSRLHTWDSVLYEQEMQRGSGHFDDESLAFQSEMQTMRCREEALARGKMIIKKSNPFWKKCVSVFVVCRCEVASGVGGRLIPTSVTWMYHR